MIRLVLYVFNGLMLSWLCRSVLFVRLLNELRRLVLIRWVRFSLFRLLVVIVKVRVMLILLVILILL